MVSSECDGRFPILRYGFEIHWDEVAPEFKGYLHESERLTLQMAEAKATEIFGALEKLLLIQAGKLEEEIVTHMINARDLTDFARKIDGISVEQISTAGIDEEEFILLSEFLKQYCS